MTRLDDYVAPRQQVYGFLSAQRASIHHFWDELNQVFFRTEEDYQRARELGKAREPSQKRIERLTSTVTCMESLLEAPNWYDIETSQASNDWAYSNLVQFMDLALDKTGDWESDEAAWVYCRVRTLGAALRQLGGGKDWTTTRRRHARTLIEWAWRSHPDEGGAFGLREATEYRADGRSLGDRANSRQYPSNAFLTYWGLLAAELAGGLKLKEDGPANVAARGAATDWLRANLSAQIAFHYNGSNHVDPQQLAYSLCGLIRFGDGAALANTISVDHELLSAGLRAFFEQCHDGTWATGAPLFHYRNAGNAYAYIYETLGELLSLATSADVPVATREAVQDALREYGAELFAAFEGAERSGQILGEGVFGWSSGHHPHRNTPECWATASVFRFAQAFRRLLGMWSAAEARQWLNARRPTSGLDDLRHRGSSWDLGSGTGGGILSTAFVQPTMLSIAREQRDSRFPNDPDMPLLEEEQARSAMLFGPPGTGKTKLIEAIAGALNWHFVEITPSQFLDRGVDFVSARADEIFRKFKELDRCVILLDEIDELIQKRDPETESLSRFFTTTMLPRLAKLWDGRRVLFFVNTNSIERVDSAIVRSQRFDFALLLLPAGYDVKLDLLKQYEGLDLAVPETEITAALVKPADLKSIHHEIGWFALVRYDQMAGLARQIKAAGAGSVVDEDRLKTALTSLSHELARLDWNRADDDAPAVVDKAKPAPLPPVAAEYEFERSDSRRQLYAALAEEGVELPETLEVEQVGDRRWVLIGSPTNPEEWAEDNHGELTADGVFHLSAGALAD